MRLATLSLTLAVLVLAGCTAGPFGGGARTPPPPAPPAAPALPPADAPVGGQPLQARIEHGVKVFDLTAKRVMWEVQPGSTIEAWTFNGTVPGPLIRLTRGDRVRINVTNHLPESTSVHWHGQNVPYLMDGVSHLTQNPILPGQTFHYEFTADPAGTHWYHSHENTTTQLGLGLWGPLIVDPKPGEGTHGYDKEFVIGITDYGALGLTLNGKSYPATAPMVVDKGDRVLIRMFNAGSMAHPMHLHGHDGQVVAKDGYNLVSPFYVDTVNVAPGETYDEIFVANNPGLWAFHCHIPQHAEGAQGMFGLTTVVQYRGIPLPPPPNAAQPMGHSVPEDPNPGASVRPQAPGGAQPGLPPGTSATHP